MRAATIKITTSIIFLFLIRNVWFTTPKRVSPALIMGKLNIMPNERRSPPVNAIYSLIEISGLNVSL